MPLNIVKKVGMQLVCPLIQNKESAEQFIAYQNQKSLGKNKEQTMTNTNCRS